MAGSICCGYFLLAVLNKAHISLIFRTDLITTYCSYQRRKSLELAIEYADNTVIAAFDTQPVVTYIGLSDCIITLAAEAAINIQLDS